MLEFTRSQNGHFTPQCDHIILKHKTFFFYKEDLLTYKNLQKYATKYIHMYNMKYNKMAA